MVMSCQLGHDGHMSSDELIISARDIAMSYPGGKKAVCGVDLEVHRGEVFGLLGPNGAGKTTTVEILEGFRKRSAGNVNVLGMDPWNAPRSWKGKVGIVLQSTGSSDEVTVAEALRLQGAYYGNPRPLKELMELVGLTGQANVRIDRLSGGQQRRLDVARGIIGRPELVFLDEPTTGFDPEARRQFWDLIRSLQADGTTVLLTTHYIDEAEALADRIAVMVDGRIVALDTPANLGGRNADESIVSWTEDGQPHQLAAARPARVVADLVTRLGDDIADLTVTRPSLEDTYLELVRTHTNSDSDRELL
jgi:ABC-2 type transport system ATP-binding protein